VRRVPLARLRWTGARTGVQAAPVGGISRATRERSWAASQFAWRPTAAMAILILSDWLVVLGCLAAVAALRSGPLQRMFPGWGALPPLGEFIGRLYYLLPWTLALAARRLYTRRGLFWDEARHLLHACTLAALFAVVLSFAERSAESLSRLVITGTWLATCIALPLSRYETKRLLSALGLWKKKVLVVGAGETGAQVGRRLSTNPDLGYEAVAFVDDDPQRIGTRQDGVLVRGPLETIPELVRELQAKDVVLAVPGMSREKLLHLISVSEGHVESIRVVPDLFGLASVGVEAEDLDGVLLLHMRWNLAKPWNLLFKRAFDLLVAVLAAVLLAPFLALIAIAVRLDSPGPIFFVQERIGRGRRVFRCVKFRTMFVDAEKRLGEYLAAHPEQGADWERFAKLKSFDPRVTRVGGFLRRVSLDELPQIWNVFRREMSFVGPRPYLPSETERMGDFATTILKAPPGITGLWQVSGRNNLTFGQRLRLDEYYVRNWSLWMDLVVLLKTGGALLRRDGAY
jgi:Undecaprenyl-phosphate galactose phosphotransferase WbaP